MSDYSETTSLVIPIIVYNKNNPKNKIETYALLDDASDSCFIQEGLIDKLQLPKITTQLKMRTLVSASLVDCYRVNEVIIQDSSGKCVELPSKVYSQVEIPCSYEDIPTPDIAMRYKHLKEIAYKISPLRKDLEIGLLIGNNCPEALCPLQVLQGNKGEPYGVRTALGWGIIGPKRGIKENAVSSFRIACNQNISLTKEVVNPWLSLDFPESVLNDRKSAMSIEDKRFMKLLEENVRHREDNHYELPLPFKINNMSLPNNRAVAVKRLHSLKSRFEKNQEYRSDYVKFVEDMLNRGHAEPVPKGEAPTGRTWYIPHHGVYHPKKPGKIRVVFDCSAIYKGVSLNSLLLSGPDLTSSIIGVLMRFREGYVAICGDIEGMFHQVVMREEDRDFLRFLWWEEGDTSSPIKEYRMTVHLFGASSSPGCSNFALKQAGKDNEATIGEKAAQFVKRDFYVDDGCTSVDKVSEAIQLLKDVRDMCSLGGFRFHKIISNNKEVLLSIPPEERATGLKNFDPLMNSLPSAERILGVPWDVEKDIFKVQVSVKTKSPTRRNILSEICSVHDPLGFVAPYVLRGKAILQDICRELRAQNRDCWDEEVSEWFQERWQEWSTNLFRLNDIVIPRCYKASNFGMGSTIQVHIFSDASSLGYGVFAYLRLVNRNDRVHCSFIIGKSRVCPLKPISIPRLELTAAVVASRIGTVIRDELTFEEVEFHHWTDSKVVLGYIKNESRRYQIFVANRVQEIRELTEIDSWHYVPTKENPADIASRGPSAEVLLKSCWLRGPNFLWNNEESWKNSCSLEIDIIDGDPEVKACTVVAMTEYPSLSSRLGRYGSWKRARRSIAWVFRYFKILKCKSDSRKIIQGNAKDQPLLPEELLVAETRLVKLIQREAFAEEFKFFESNNIVGRLKRTSKIGALNPILDEFDILRVGGRLKKGIVFNEAQKHPIILPGDCHLTRLLIRHFHEEHHLGRSGTINRLRSAGYWVTRCSTVVRSLISNCVVCRKARGRLQVQRMADLPIQRLEPAAPFTHSAVDCFGPYMVKEGRKHLKRYGVIFTCLACRGIYLDVTDSLSTDSFINALRRFFASKGPIASLRSDLGTNFVGAREELKRCIGELNEQCITHYLSQQFCTFEWKFNVPRASHMNGVVERQIGTVRKVLDVILMQNPGLITEDDLRTFFKECERVVNDRPLGVTNLLDPQSVEPLTPNHAILMNAKPLLPPPGSFDSGAVYVRKRWRRIQYLTNEFWARWKREYALSLQSRKKWKSAEENLREGDVVLCKDENINRNVWPMARVAKVHPGQDGLVRKVTLCFSNGSKLDRPIHKTVLLVRFPNEEPK